MTLAADQSQSNWNGIVDVEENDVVVTPSDETCTGGPGQRVGGLNLQATGPEQALALQGTRFNSVFTPGTGNRHA